MCGEKPCQTMTGIIFLSAGCATFIFVGTKISLYCNRNNHRLLILAVTLMVLLIIQELTA